MSNENENSGLDISNVIAGLFIAGIVVLFTLASIGYMWRLGQWASGWIW